MISKQQGAVVEPRSEGTSGAGLPAGSARRQKSGAKGGKQDMASGSGDMAKGNKERIRNMEKARASKNRAGAKGATMQRRVSKSFVAMCTAFLAVVLTLSLIGVSATSPAGFAAGSEITASSLTNNNLGKHPLHTLISWDATGENLKDGGKFNWSAAVTGDYVDASGYKRTGMGTKHEDKQGDKVIKTWYEDEITPEFITTAVKTTENDNGGNTILEQSPSFQYKRETRIVNGETYTIYVDSNGNEVYFDKIAQDIALKYGFREGKELVFNINDEGTAARVWSDAILFTQHIGPAECIPFVSYTDYGRYKDTGIIPDTTMYAFDNGDYIFRTKLTKTETDNGLVVYNEHASAYGVWEKYDESKNNNSEYLLKSDGSVQRFAHFFVNDNGSYYYHTDTRTMTTSSEGNVESYTTPGYEGAKAHLVKYSLYDPNYVIDDNHKEFKSYANGYNADNDSKLMPGAGTLNVHGPVYRGNYFIENGRYEGWGETSAYGGAKLMGQYVTVRLNCDWKAKEITTSVYSVEGKTTSFDYVYTNEKQGGANYEYYSYNSTYTAEKESPEIKYFGSTTSDGYTIYYDASSIPFATGHTPFSPYNELCAFSNGRINVPVGSYIVLDLNGHTIDRGLSEAYDDTAANSAYQYFGSVFSVNEYARLEVYDGTAFENASDTHISGENKDKSDKNYGANGGLTTDQAGTITGGYVTHQFSKDSGNGRSATEGNTVQVGDSNFKTLKLNVDGDNRTEGETATTFPASVADDNQAKGAAIHMFAHSDLVFHSGTIRGNNAASQYGGAVYLLTNSSMTMFDGYIINNQAYRIGGGIYLADSSASVLTMYNGVVGYNYGGAGKLGITESNDLREDGLKQFRAIENYGGGIALRTKAYCNLYGGELVGNYAFGPGGGMYIQGTAVGTLAGVTIKNNHTYGSPGGQGGSFAPYGGGGGIFVGGTGARIGFRGALQIVDNFRDNIIENTEPTGKAGDWQGKGGSSTSIKFTAQETTDNLHLPMQERTRDTTGHTNPTTNGTGDSGENENGTGDGSPASYNYDVNWNSNATIVISGPLIENGIVANIGITMQAANAPFNSTLNIVFTQQYQNNGDTQHNDLAPHYFFKSDNPAYSIMQTTDTHEAYLKNETPEQTGLTWVVEGTGIDADTKTDESGAPALSTLRVVVKPDGTLDYYYKNPNRSAGGAFKTQLAKVTEATEIDSAAVELSNKETTKSLLKILNNSFVATSGSLDFEYSMLNVTRVAVYSDTPDLSGETLTTSNRLAYWETTGKDDSFGINSTFYTSNFRFKLGEQDFQFDNHAENASAQAVPKESPMYKAIKATDESLSYAGRYSFLYQSEALYANPTFKINIKQVGIEATRTCYFDGGDVTERSPVPWTKGEDFSWQIGTDPTKNNEPNAPYFLYRGDYYYPVLSADFKAPVKGSQLIATYGDPYVRARLRENTFFADDDYIRVVDPEKSGDCLFIRESVFNGYVLNFRYANLYFGTDSGHKRDVHFGAHDGGGVEYKTLHKKPGSEVAEGQYVDGVKHAGTYLVTFVASANGQMDDTGVYFASNNFAFNAEVRLLVEAANAEVQLTENARNNLVYSGALYEDRQIAEFDNTSDTKVIPVNDNAVIFRYFLYDDNDIWVSDKPTLDDLKLDVLDKKFSLEGDVTAQKYKEDGTPNTIPGTLQEPLNARTYIVVVTLDLDMNYEEYDYIFTKDAAHLVPIDVDEEKQSYVWAYWFTIDPAEINPYETGTTVDNGNTEINVTKDKYFNGKSYGYAYDGDSFDKASFSDQANLPTEIIFSGGASETKLALGQDYDVEFVGFAEKNAPESKQFNFLDASVGIDSDSKAPEVDGYKFGDYNLAVKITFGGTNHNYVNSPDPETAGSADDVGTAYEDESGAFYIYFRILPIIVTASANMSYIYDGGNYDRGRFLAASGEHGDWYESIFFLAQDSIVTPAELIANQKDKEYSLPYPDAPDSKRTLDDLWGGIEGDRAGTVYDDTSFYMARYTIGDVNVQYTNSDFIANGVLLGVGMYAFRTESANYKGGGAFYHLPTIDFDNEKSIDKAPEKAGVMWLLTVGSTQSFVDTNNEKTAATNFIVSTQSYLNVTINQRSIEGDDVDVKFNGEAYTDETPEKAFPYAAVAYVPPVELSFTTSRPSDKSAAERPKDTIKLALYAAAPYDFYTTYNNNTTVSTDTAKAQVILNANKRSASDGNFSGNFYGSRTINFRIVPAHIQATIDGEHEFPYDGSAKTLKVTYTNTDTYNEDILSPKEGFTAPVPNASEVTTQYKKLENGEWGPNAPADAGKYRMVLYSSANFQFEATPDFKLYAEDATNRSARTIADTSDLVIDPRKVYIGPSVDSAEADLTGHGIVTKFTYNRNLQSPQLKSSNICSVSDATGDWVANFDDVIIPSSSNYTVTYTNVSPDASTSYSNRDGYSDAGDYWMILDLTSDNFVWGGVGVVLFKHTELSDKRLAVQYTISPSAVVLKPNDSISGAIYPEGTGTLHFVYDGVRHDVGVTLSSGTLAPMSTEYQLSAVSFVGSPSFIAGADVYMSVYAGTYSFTVTFTGSAANNYKWSDDQGGWDTYNAAHPNSVIVDEAGTGSNTGNKIVYVNIKNNTVTITYTIDKARVYIDSIDSKLYNRSEQDDININFKNEVEANSKVPTNYGKSFAVSKDENQWLYQPYDSSIEGSKENKVNAKLGDNSKPYYAGNYDATITLQGDDANNFFLVQKESYTSDRNIETASQKADGKTVDYSDKVAGSDGKSAVALFVIEALGVYASQTLASVMFDNKDHFMGDPYGIDAKDGRYGGVGPWTISYSSLNGETPVDGISYNIKFENEKYLVVIKMGGYSHGSDVKTLDPDAIYLQRKGEDDVAKKINATDDDAGIKAAFAQIQALGLFTNAETYKYTLTFEFANFYFAGELGGDELLPKVKPLQFTINPAFIAPGTLANKKFNNHEQEPDFNDDSFAAVGDTNFEAGTTIFDILDGYNKAAAGSGFTFSYAADGGNAALGSEHKPFNAGTYTVTVKLASENFTFSGTDTATMTFVIDPFDISGLSDGQFKVTLPSVRYTGMPMKTYLSQVEVEIEGETVTLVLLASSATDGKLQLGKNGYDFNISSYDNNVNASLDKATAHIAGSNNFAGELTRIFTISKRQIHVNINDNLGNVYGVNPNSGMDKPSNLGDVRDVDWSFDGADALKSADQLTALIEASVNMAYGDDATIATAIEAFDKLNGESADKFVYDSDNLYVALSIFNGEYNRRPASEHANLLVGKWRIVGGATNENYEVSFSGNYKTQTSSGDVGDEQYGLYEVIQRKIVITPADLGITYGEAEHTYSNNSQDDKYLYWTASSDYAGDAILAEDLAKITAGISLVIANTSFSASGWLNVGTYLIRVDNIGNIGTLAENTNASSVKECYTIAGSGTWVDGAMGAAVETVAEGIGGTYTVSARNIKVNVLPNVMGYEYNKEEPYNNLDTDEKYNILKYMLEVAKKKEGGGSYTYADLVSLTLDDAFLNFAEARGLDNTADSWADLNLRFIKDEGVDAITYSVTPYYTNSNYNVTFEGTSNSVTISPRKIVVHINDQSSIYGEDVVVGTAEGKEANWYAMLAEDSTYWDASYSSDTAARIAAGRLGEDKLSLTISKEFGANVGIYYLSGTYANSNYTVTFEGNWKAAISTTTGKDGDPTDLTAGIYEITVRPVTVTILGQSGVYGGNQHISVGATENTHWRAESGSVGSGVVNNDSLGIKITIVYDSLNEKSNQLNVGWYSLRVSYNNPNYLVTFVGDNSNLAVAQYVKDYAAHTTVDVTSHEGSYDVSNAYYVYARVISIAVQPQAFQYNGSAPKLNQGSEWWTANNVINGELPAILSGDREDFAKAVELELVEPTEGDSMYEIWKKWGMWSVGLYETKCGIKATLNDPKGKLSENYELVTGDSSVLGALRITPADISVMHDGQTSTYNKKAPSIVQTSYTIDSEETKVFSSRKWNEAESKFADNATTDKDKLNFEFTFDGTDYGAGRHFILGNWAEPDNANPNYNVTFNTGTYIINKRNLVITIVPQYAIYGETLWAGENWWQEVADSYGEQTPNTQYWSVAVTNANADDSGIFWMDNDDRLDLRIAPVIGAQQGANAGDYTISGSWNSSNDDYNVTFKTATYTIYKRAIIVHINDQGGVYGSFAGGSSVDQSRWSVVGFDSDKQKDICGGHDCGTPKEPYVVVTDALSISLTLGEKSDATEGVYNNFKIVGNCNNPNYEVTWVGGKKVGDDGNEYERDHGIFGLTKRQVTVNILNQSAAYGKLRNGSIDGFDANGYTAQATNDTVNRNAFIADDKVRIVLSVHVIYSDDGRGNYNQAGRYAITVRIYETIGEAETLIYSSVESEQGTVMASDKYELTVKGDYEDRDFKEGYKGGESGNETIHDKTGAYDITRIDLSVTVLDKSSVYGEPVVAWEFNMTGAMTEEEEFIKGKIQLTIDGETNEAWSGTRHDAKAYVISAKLDDATINNNYNVVFRTQYGTTYNEESEPKVTATYTVTKRMLSVNVNRRGSTYGDELVDLTFAVSPVGSLTGPAIVSGDELDIRLAIFEADKDYNLSTSKHLKVGIYPIVGSWNDDPNYELTFAGTWSFANTVTWGEQRTQNGSADLEAKHNEFDGHAGVYQVEMRNLIITLGTKAPHSEYGDPIVGLDLDDFHNTDKSWGYSFANKIESDVISFEMTTSAREGSDAKAYAITAAEGSYEISGDNDNENYTIKFTEGTYTVEPRKMSVQLTAKEPKTEKGYATDVYGTTYEQDKKFSYIFYRTGTEVGAESSGWYGSDRISLKITPIEAEGFRITETGFYPVGQYMLRIEAVTEAETNNANYVFTDMGGISMRYVVTQRPITIYINEQESVFGETITVHQGQGEGLGYGWHVVPIEEYGTIVEGNDKVDDLGITITKDTGDRWTEKGYKLSARATNGNYAITWQGNWEDSEHGTYTIKKRLLLIRIHNQYSIYGESVRVSSETSAWEVVDPATVGGDVKYYTLLDGQTPDITLNIYTTVEGGDKIWYTRDASTEFSGTIGRGEYHIGVQFIGNPDYDIKVEEDYLPDVNAKSQEQKRKELITKFPDDFGETTTLKTIEVKNPVISAKLAASNNATYFVTIRPVTIKINDQSGVYGDYLTLNSLGEGASPAYTIELGKYLGDFVTTGKPFVGDYKATFDLVTTAFEESDDKGEHPVGKKAGWSLGAGTYPIFGEAYHVFMGSRAVADNSEEAAKLSHNYQFNFEGAYTGEETYPSGTTFKNRAGVYTVEKRQISLTATNGSAIYGGVDTEVLIPTLDQSNYTAINGNSKTSSHEGVTHEPIISEDDKKALNIRLVLEYEPENRSSSDALKVGHYTIRLDYDKNANYEITKVNNGDFEVLSRQASILIVQSAATATYLAAIPSEWAVKAIGDHASMYQLSNALEKDIIAFTMTTVAKAGDSVGQYALSGSLDEAAAGNDNGNYSITFTSGTFEITKKSVDVTISDQSSIYGENINVNVPGKWTLPVGWNKDGEVTNNDDETALHIVLSTTADARTDVGRYQIAGSYDINGDVGKNYDLHFVGTWNASEGMTNGNGGTLTITPRDIVVVIKAQTITYRDDTPVDQYAWFAWREKNTATWTGEHGTVNDRGVLGPKDTLDALRVYLTKGEATDIATYGPNTGAGTYVGTYAIVGSYTSSNYAVVFAYERAEADFDYSSVEDNEDGVFTITPYDITIKILNLGGDNSVGYGGTDYVKNGGGLYFGAELVNDENTIWEYADEKSFLPTELGYLSFRLGGDYSSDVYAFKGQHPIVGYWGYGLNDRNATDYRMQFNYNVTFTGDWAHALNDVNSSYGYDALYDNSGKTADGTCGVFTISNAKVGQLSYSQSYDDGEDNGSHWHGQNWNREAAFSGNEPDNPKHSMGVNAEDLAFAGDVAFGGGSVNFLSHVNRELEKAVVITYSDLQHDGVSEVWADMSKAPEEQAVGKWTVTVTVNAPYHDVETFTLTLTITRIDITIYLNDKNIDIPYGTYKLSGGEVSPADPAGTALNDLLKQLLFRAYDENEYLDKTRSGGPIASAGTDGTSSVQNIVQYLLRNSDVQVSISTRSTDASSGGYLIVQKYVLTISAGENMSIRFGGDYNNVNVVQKALTADWTPDAGYTQDVNADGRPEYVYKFEHKDISVIPRVTKGDILLGDLVLLDDDGISAFSFNIYKLKEDGGQTLVNGNVITDVGTYKIEILNNLTPIPDKNVDINNYTTPVGEYVYVVINPATITIIIKDQSSEYGENVTLGQDDWWYIKTGDPLLDRPDGKHPSNVPDTGEPLESLGITLYFEGDVTPVNAGSYAISGDSISSNYEVVFEGSFDGTKGTYRITQRNILVKVKSFSFVYGADIHENLADDTNQYQFVHVVKVNNGVTDVFEERPAEIAVLPRDMNGINFGITVKNPQMTETGYLKVGTYEVEYSWDNDNYSVSYADADGDLQGSSLYEVKVRVDKAILTVTIHGRTVKYGDIRPAMPENYNITGLAPRDKAHYDDAGLDRPDFIEFVLRDSETAKQLEDFGADVADKYKFDPVGVYIIIGTCTPGDDIGDNYTVEFSGEWAGAGDRYDDYIGKAGTYEVTPRTLTIIIGNVETEYGDIVPDSKIPFMRAPGPGNALAGDDSNEDLHLTFVTDAVISVEGGGLRTNNVNTYSITAAVSGNKNYIIDGYIAGTYTIKPRNITIELFDMAHAYGDNHLGWLSAATLGSNWTAHRSTVDLTGDGIAYPDDKIVGQIELFVNGITDRSVVNDYTLSYRQNGTDPNYNVTGHTDATYSITKRHVQLFLKEQTSEYGDRHIVSSNTAYFDFTLLEPLSNKSEAVVFVEDKLFSTLRLFFVNEINLATDAGEYLIDASFSDDNYDVIIAGDIRQDERMYGKYTVSKRKIVVTLGAKQTSEYGDPVMPDAAYGVGWTARRPDGHTGEAIVNGDEVSLTLSVLDASNRTVDSTFPVGDYALCIASTEGFDKNYDVTYEAETEFHGSVSGHIGETLSIYKIVERQIVVEFGGTSEYGDAIVVSDISYRANGKEGPAIVNGDELGYTCDWKNGEPTGAHGLAERGEYALTLGKESSSEYEENRKNYIITTAENSRYIVTPRKVTVKVTDSGRTYGDAYVPPSVEERLVVTRTTPGAEGEPILNGDIRFFSLSVIDGDDIAMTDGRPYYAGAYNYLLTYNEDNENYDIVVEYGHYIVSPKDITVNIDTKTSKYSENILDLTYDEDVQGLLVGDELNIMLSVLWGTDDLYPEYHNAGTYAIKGVWNNPNYNVTFHGDLGEFGAYVIQKADNLFTKGYDGNGTVYLGDNFRDGDLPTALWGNDSVRYEYYLDEAMTQLADFDDVTDALEGVYYVKAIVDEAINWTGAATSFTVHVVNTLGLSDGLDITAYVCIYASQFFILVGALIFVKRKKDKKTKTNTSKAGN